MESGCSLGLKINPTKERTHNQKVNLIASTRCARYCYRLLKTLSQKIKENQMKKEISITIAVFTLIMVTSALAEGFSLKDNATGKVYGPFQFKDGARVKIEKVTVTVGSIKQVLDFSFGNNGQ
jgi:hypothetical protein